MFSEPEPHTATRMRTMHDTAAAIFRAQPSGTREVWGWLRLMSALAGKAGGKFREGPLEAEQAMP